MPNLAKLQVMGNVTRDVQMRSYGGGVVANFSVAVNRSRKVKGEYVKSVSFFDVTAWGVMATKAQERLKKGDPVFVDGEFYMDEFEGKDGPQKRWVLNASLVEPLSYGPRQSQSPDQEYTSRKNPQNEVDEEVPF
jgi:single-strand DNA-binding protein